MYEVENKIAEFAQRLALSETHWLRLALTHTSFANEHPEHASGHNERLEFLGDSVLSLCVSHLLMERDPSATEGRLSKLRSSLVDEHTLAIVARKLQLGDMLLLGRGEELSGGRDKASLLANAVEAVIAAIYLAEGFPRAIIFVRDQLGEHVEELLRHGKRRDHKTQLQELTQKQFNQAPLYEVVETKGPEHAKIFVISLTLNGEILGYGDGRSKKEAEQKAAEMALEELEKREAKEPPGSI
jgi:ribonuclease-3